MILDRNLSRGAIVGINWFIKCLLNCSDERPSSVASAPCVIVAVVVVPILSVLATTTLPFKNLASALYKRKDVSRPKQS